MKKTVILAVIAIAATTIMATSGFSQSPPTDEERTKAIGEIAEVQKFFMMPMRDGVRMATDIYLPKDASGPLPTIFWKTPYNYNKLSGPWLTVIEAALEQGYAFVMQNERGKFFSEGTWELLGLPRTDSYDALTWIAGQSWSNGRVGTLGCSSSAEPQMALAAMNHPAHAAMVPMSPGAGIGRVGKFYEQGNWYRGGAEQMFYLPWLYPVQLTEGPKFPSDLSDEDRLRLSTYFDLAPSMPPIDWAKLIWHLPIGEAMLEANGPKGIYAELFARKPNDEGWYQGGLYHDDEDIGVPALWAFTWYDFSISPNLALFNHVSETAPDPEVRDNQYVVIAPGLHCSFFRNESPLTVGEQEMGNIDFDYMGMIFGFFDKWLKGDDSNFPADTPKVQYFAQGANEWRSAEVWPPATAQPVTLYLQSDGHANSLFGDGRLTWDAPGEDGGFDAYTYDPATPVPSLGGGICCIGNAVEGGSFDQRGIEARADVLVYTTEELSADVNVTGYVEVTLYVSSDARDTDFTIKLIDVYPDGRALNLDETIQRARYRDGYESEVFMEDGGIYEVTLSVLSTSNVFRAGHRIRLEVSSSNFPRFSRNLNTGGDNYNESEFVVAHNVIHHSADYASRMVLPVIDE